jgi:DNA-binding MarR family transcriptional regulator
MAEHEFASTGLPPSHGFIIMAVNKQPGITAGEVSNIMQLQPSTVTRLLDKLEKGGYVTRQSDGKFIEIYPTAKARRLNEPLKAAWQNLYRRYASVLGEEPSRELTAAIYEAGNKLETR